MVQPDTIRLMRECDAGIQMGVGAIDDVLDYTKDSTLRQCLVDCKNRHIVLKDELQILLRNCHDEGKEPNPVAKSMSWIKTNAKLAIDNSDSAIASLITDGCNMGVKSLNKYLNQYKAADGQSTDIAKRLISLEENLVSSMRPHL